VKVRTDNGEDKALLPTIGLWFSAELEKQVQDDGTEKLVVDWMIGLNAVMVEY
jgi:hypothetical protein